MKRGCAAMGAAVLTGLLVLNIQCPLLGDRGEGPLFVQVHFTSPREGLTERELDGILKGGGTSLEGTAGGGAITVYVHAPQADLVRRRYPGLAFRVRDFADPSLGRERGFLGISDVSGLRPWFRCLSVGGSLPWGRVADDYTLGPAGDYPFTAPGAEPWDEEKHVTFVQTGTTAMTRAFIARVEAGGDLYAPVRRTAAITSGADIAATSNEVSFLDPCTYPLPDRMSFCSPKRYFGILEKAGFDVIELTGNHNNDYGRRHNLATMGMIEKAGMTYFGGGINRGDAKRVRYRTVKGVTFAFLGFNQWGPDAAWATGDGPGAARFSEAEYLAAVREAVAKADVVVVSMQWGNEDNPVPHDIQKANFRKAAGMGATIMLSSSSHRAMGLEFHRGKFISYGLGNFLFDQMQTVNHRRGMIARHHFYGKRHVQTELIPFLMQDHSRPTPVRGREARELFDEVFRYSLGEVFGR
ncbi:MAG: CapA family protein [Spirochaetes bacterium]|nr:CapA family protein [Spirochaetota bacterium]